MKNISIFAKEWGPPGQADAFLFLHGVESHSGWFAAVADRLVSQGLWTRAYDRTGWGQSSGTRGHAPDVKAVLEEARDNVKQLKERGAKRIHLIGQSWGALVAITLSQLAPDELFRMTLISPGLYPSIAKSLGIASRAVGGILRGGYDTVPISLGTTPEAFSPSPDSQNWISKDNFRVTAISCQTLVTTLRFTWRCGTLLPHGAFAVPTQVLVGSLDVMIDRNRTLHFARRKGAQIEVVPGAGHALVLDAPILVADALLRFHENHV